LYRVVATMFMVNYRLSY